MKHQKYALPTQGKVNFRLLILNFVAVSVSLGTAVSALGRLALYLLALLLVVANMTRARPRTYWPDSPWPQRWQIAALAAIAFMAISALWSTADSTKAVLSWSRHARLLTIPLMWIAILNMAEAKSVLRVLVVTQLFVVLSAWLLIAGLPVPWATAFNATSTYAVFGSYLEQSIMGATLVFVLWHQRHWIFGKNGQWLALAAALMTAIQILGFLAGRSGYLVFIALASMAVMYHLSGRYRWLAIASPFVIAVVLFTDFKTVRDRAMLVQQEITAYVLNNNAHSSSGERLTSWQTSLQSIAEHPVLGTGSGSWNHEFRRLTEKKPVSEFYVIDNPHQMFLLWAVEGGAVGLVLLCTVLLSIWLRSLSLAQSDARSLQSAIVALTVAGLTTSTIYGIGMGDYFCVLIGVLLATGHRAADQPATPAHLPKA